MTTTDRLNAAAKKLRGAAGAATPGPWAWEEPSTGDWPQGDESLISTSTGDHVLCGWGYDASGIEADDNDRAYIALVAPPFALLVAKVLEEAASNADCEDPERNPALALADLILGGRP